MNPNVNNRDTMKYTVPKNVAMGSAPELYSVPPMQKYVRHDKTLRAYRNEYTEQMMDPINNGM
jgi:hypothetical protein